MSRLIRLIDIRYNCIYLNMASHSSLECLIDLINELRNTRVLYSSDH